MANILPGFPDLTDHSMTVVLDDVQYRVRFAWNERMSGWYWDLRDADENAIALGQRLSSGSGYRMRRGGPAGAFFCYGAERYKQSDLGGALQLIYFPVAELPAEVTDTHDVVL